MRELLVPPCLEPGGSSLEASCSTAWMETIKGRSLLMSQCCVPFDLVWRVVSVSSVANGYLGDTGEGHLFETVVMLPFHGNPVVLESV